MIFVPFFSTLRRAGFPEGGDRNAKSTDCRDKSGTIFYKSWTIFSYSPSCEGRVSPCFRLARVIKCRRGGLLLRTSSFSASKVTLFSFTGKWAFLILTFGRAASGSCHLSYFLPFKKTVFIAQCFFYVGSFYGFRKLNTAISYFLLNFSWIFLVLILFYLHLPRNN